MEGALNWWEWNDVGGAGQGLATEEEVDVAVRRVLALKARLGLLEGSEAQPYAGLPLSIIGSPDHLRLALEASTKSEHSVLSTPSFPNNTTHAPLCPSPCFPALACKCLRVVLFVCMCICMLARFYMFARMLTVASDCGLMLALRERPAVGCCTDDAERGFIARGAMQALSF